MNQFKEANSYNWYLFLNNHVIILLNSVSALEFGFSYSGNDLANEWKLRLSIKYILFPNTFEQSHGYKAVTHTYSLDLDVDLIGTSTGRNVVINSGKRFPWIDVLWGSFMALFLVATINSAVDFQGYVRVKIRMW